MNEVLQNIKARHSTRVYTEKQVSVEDLSLILEAATHAPSGMNFQDWHFTAIQNADLLRQLNDKVKEAFAASESAVAGAWPQRFVLLLLSCSYAGDCFGQGRQLVDSFRLCLCTREHFSGCYLPRH